MIDMGKWVDGIYIIQDSTQKEQRDRREQIERDTQDERKPLPDIPLTEAELRKRCTRRLAEDFRRDLRNGIDRS